MAALRYGGRLIGRRLLRVREAHIRDHTAVLLNRKAVGAAKLDLVLRGLARVDEHCGRPGVVPTGASWVDLHDFCRLADRYVGASALKGKWTAEQLRRLERMHLVQREHGRANRPQVVVLRDDGSRLPYDDPSGHPPDSYVTVSGWVIAGGWLQRWGAPELAAYLAAMIAERYARADPVLAAAWRLDSQVVGTGKWYRPLKWFADPDGSRPEHHVRIPFSERTLRRGFKSLIDVGLVSTYWTITDPRTGERFPSGPRVIYINRFNKLRPLVPRDRGSAF